MAAPQLNLDLSAIAIGSPRVPEPIATALATVQTTINSLGNVHIAADAAIAISKTEMGTFSDWADWIPTIATIGGTLTSTAVAFAEWTREGDTVTLEISFSGTAGGGACVGANFTSPIAPVRTTNWLLATGCQILDSGAVPRAATCSYLNGKWNIYNNAAAALANGATSFSAIIRFRVA